MTCQRRHRSHVSTRRQGVRSRVGVSVGVTFEAARGVMCRCPAAPPHQTQVMPSGHRRRAGNLPAGLCDHASFTQSEELLDALKGVLGHMIVTEHVSISVGWTVLLRSVVAESVPASRPERGKISVPDLCWKNKYSAAGVQRGGVGGVLSLGSACFVHLHEENTEDRTN